MYGATVRGILSFVLVMLVAQAVLYIYDSYTKEVASNYRTAEDILRLQKFYKDKMTVKRGMYRILSGPALSQDPISAVEEKASQLEAFEATAEAQTERKVDVWCGYINSGTLDLMLESAKSGLFVKPPNVWDARDKITVDVGGAPVELHACSAVLVFDFASGTVKIGRGQGGPNYAALTPAVGVTIADPDSGIYDVDYYGVS